MTTWFERRPGSEETLLALYDAVPEAEELDLEEQASFEAFWVEAWGRDQHGLVTWKWWADDDESDDVSDTEPDDESDDAGTRPSMSQALGIVEHLLGGRLLDRTEPTA